MRRNIETSVAVILQTAPILQIETAQVNAFINSVNELSAVVQPNPTAEQSSVIVQKIGNFAQTYLSTFIASQEIDIDDSDNQDLRQNFEIFRNAIINLGSTNAYKFVSNIETSTILVRLIVLAKEAADRKAATTNEGKVIINEKKMLQELKIFPLYVFKVLFSCIFLQFE